MSLLHTDHPADLDPATLGRMTPDDMRAAATWLLDGYEYAADDEPADANALALARVGRWLLAEADRRELDAALRRIARDKDVPLSAVRAAYRQAAHK